MYLQILYGFQAPVSVNENLRIVVVYSFCLLFNGTKVNMGLERHTDIQIALYTMLARFWFVTSSNGFKRLVTREEPIHS